MLSRLPVRSHLSAVLTAQAGADRSPRTFGLGFLQTPPRGDALALLLPSCLRAARKQVGSTYTWSGDFHPGSRAPCPAHTTRISCGAERRQLHAVVRRLTRCRLHRYGCVPRFAASIGYRRPDSRKLKYSLRLKMMWSSSAIPTTEPADLSWPVTSTSVAEGSKLPVG